VRISQKLEYAFRALAQLAKCYDAKTITRLDEIAQREDVSANFLVQILNELRNSGIITSKRGKMGGYILAKAPSQITLLDIINSVEPAMVDRTVSTDGESGEKLADVWSNASSFFTNHLKSITLDTLVPETPESMFYI